MSFVQDTLRTIAILDDSAYLRGAERMARATERIGVPSRNNPLERYDGAAAGLTLAGGMLMGLEAQAIKTGSQFQQMQRSLKTLAGEEAGGKLYEDLKQFTFLTPYTTSVWANQARMLMGFGVEAKNVIPVLNDLGDAVTGAFGVDPVRLAALTYATSEMNVGFANARHVQMFQRAGVNPYKYIEKYLGLNENQIANIGTLHIPGRYINAAILKGIEEDPSRHGAQIKFMHTLAGEASNLSDAWQQFMANSSSPALEPLGHAIHFLADQLKALSSPRASGAAGYALLLGGPALLATGGILKAVGYWKQLAAAKNIATLAAVAENGAEKEKLGTLTTEASQVTAATTRWSGLGTVLGGLAMRAAGLVALAVALRGVADAYHAVSSPMGGKDMEFDAAYGDYRRNRGAAAADALWHLPRTLQHGLTGGFGGADSFKRFANAGQAIVEHSKSPEAAAAFNRLLPRLLGVENNWKGTPMKEVQDVAERLHTIVENARQYSPSQAALTSAQKAADATNDALLAEYNQKRDQYLKPKSVAGPREHAEYDVDKAETMMKIAKLSHNQAQYNMYRRQAITLITREIDLLRQYAASIEHIGGKANEWLATQKKILGLMEKKTEFQEDKSLGGTAFDKTTANILSAAGLGEDDLSKLGVNRHLFAQLSKGKIPDNPVSSALAQAAKRPIVIQFVVADKVMQEFKTQAKDDVLNALLMLTDHGGLGTLPRK